MFELLYVRSLKNPFYDVTSKKVLKALFSAFKQINVEDLRG